MQGIAVGFGRVAGIAPVVFATLCSYLLGYSLTTLPVLSAIAADFANARGYIRSVTVFWGNPVFWLAGRKVHASGRENSVPGKPYLVLANHASI